MSREDTTKIKKEVMSNIVKILSGSRIDGRNFIKTPKHMLRVWASRDYEDEGTDMHNWYGLFEGDLNPESNKILLFTNTTVFPYKSVVMGESNFLLTHLYCPFFLLLN